MSVMYKQLYWVFAINVIWLCSTVWTTSALSVCVTNPVAETGSQCFEVHRSEVIVTHQDAQMFCRTNQEELATFLSVHSEARVGKTLPDNTEAWIGLRLHVTTTWRWLHKDGWYSNMVPDSDIHADRGGACLYINRGGLSSYSCNHQMEVVCQQNSQPSREDCPSGIERLGESQWLCFTNRRMSWVAASRHCMAQNGSTIIIDSDSTLAKMKKILEAYAKHFWTAGTKVAASWDDGRVDTNPLSLHWNTEISHNPNLEEASPDGLCVAVTNKGLLYKRCSQQLSHYVCYKPGPDLTTAKFSESVTTVPNNEDLTSITANTTTSSLSASYSSSLRVVIIDSETRPTASQTTTESIVIDTSRTAAPEDTDHTVCLQTANSDDQQCFVINQPYELIDRWTAESHCAQQDQRLSTISSVSVENALSQRLGESPGWTGLRMSKEPQSSWDWLGYDGWVENVMPDDLMDLSDPGSCLMIDRYGLRSMRCNRELGVICEKSGLLSVEDLDSCEGTAKQLDGRWMCFYRRAMTWSEAARFCESKKSSSLMINDNTTLAQVKDILLEIRGLPSWTSATNVKFSWPDGGYNTFHPFKLQWSRYLPRMPDLEETSKAVNGTCVVLGENGLEPADCIAKFSHFLCSKIRPVKEADTKKSTTDYETILIIAYILAAIFGVGLILLIAIILLKRRKERRPPFQKQASINNNNADGDGQVVLRRQRSKRPDEEWGMVLRENNKPEPVPPTRPEHDIDIIHNVPLDPRATIEQPLTIPKESQFVPVYRGTSRKSHGSSSISSDHPGSSERQSNRTSSPIPIKVAPPVPPKSPLAYREPDAEYSLPPAEEDSHLLDFPLPPPPEELLINNQSPASPTRTNAPPVPPKPKILPNTANSQPQLPVPPTRKKHQVDPIYAQVSKPQTESKRRPAPPPLPARQMNNGRHGSPHRSEESGDSGLEESSVYSPLLNGTPSQDQMAYLDQVMAQLTTS